MKTEKLTAADIADLLAPYLADGHSLPNSHLFEALERYLELLLKWNARTNLTAIREPAEIVRRHFGESVLAAGYTGKCKTLLDFGSGAGFPGIPIQLMRPEIAVTLAESQGKKAAFLREVVRELGLRSTVWNDRVEAMPEGRRFDVVALRAVDGMEDALREAGKRATTRVIVLGTQQISSQLKDTLPGFQVRHPFELPETRAGLLFLADRTEVVQPR